jgi:hypothetical protein
MPLHDWADERGWDRVHFLWIAELIHWLRPRLPAGYRAFPGSVPALAVDTFGGRPDVNVRDFGPAPRPLPTDTDPFAPDFAAVAVFTTEPLIAVQVERRGQLIAALELVSPRNKDRPSARQQASERYAGYLRRGVHLLLVDVLPHPHDFSFADALAAQLQFAAPPCSVPFALSLRVGSALPEGTHLAQRTAHLQVRAPLPTLPLALSGHEIVPIDLEATYVRTTQAAYLD